MNCRVLLAGCLWLLAADPVRAAETVIGEVSIDVQVDWQTDYPPAIHFLLKSTSSVQQYVLLNRSMAHRSDCVAVRDESGYPKPAILLGGESPGFGSSELLYSLQEHGRSDHDMWRAVTIPPRGWRHLVFYRNLGPVAAACRVHYEVSVYGDGPRKSRNLAVQIPMPPPPDWLLQIPASSPALLGMARINPVAEFMRLYPDRPIRIEINPSAYRLLHIVLTNGSARPSLIAVSAPGVQCSSGSVSPIPWSHRREVVPDTLKFGPRLLRGRSWGGFMLLAHSPDWRKVAGCRVAITAFSVTLSDYTPADVAGQRIEVPLTVLPAP